MSLNTKYDILDNRLVIRRLNAGDRQCFEACYRFYYKGLCSFASRWVSLPVAEDIVQDTMLYIWENRDRLMEELSLKGLLFMIVRNKAFDRIGIAYEKTAVGDRYVLENMRENGFAIGGEQSGHVILLHHATTGDGELTAGKLLKLLAESGKKMSELNGIYAQYPQVLVNVTANAAQKAAYKEDEVLAGFIENEQQKLMGMGRVLVRVSGTEPKIRVMVEGQDLEAIDRCAKRIVEKINKRILEGLEG